MAIRDCKATAERAKQIHDRLVVLASEAVRREAAMSERDAELRARAADVVDREESVRCRERLVAAGDDVIDQLQSANSALRRELELRSTNTEVYATIRSLIDSNAELCATSSSIVALRDEARARVAEADERLARLRPVAASAEAGLARAGGIESVCRALQDATDRAIRAASGIEAQVAAMDEANAELRGVVGAYIEHVGGPLEARLLSEWRLAAVGGVTLEASLGTALLPDSPASAAGALGGP